MMPSIGRVGGRKEAGRLSMGFCGRVRRRRLNVRLARHSGPQIGSDAPLKHCDVDPGRLNNPPYSTHLSPALGDLQYARKLEVTISSVGCVRPMFVC
jgi:hypothetical protein